MKDIKDEYANASFFMELMSEFLSNMIDFSFSLPLNIPSSMKFIRYWCELSPFYRGKKYSKSFYDNKIFSKKYFNSNINGHFYFLYIIGRTKSFHI